MGFRFRKSKKIGGVRLNFSRKGIGYSVGNKYLGFSHSATGRKTVRTSVPGTGISYSTSVGGKSGKKKSSSSGGCIVSLFKVMFGLVFLPITIIVLLVKNWDPDKKKKQEPENPQVQNPTPEDIASQNRDANLQNYRQMFTRQLNETVTLLNETNNISVLFSRCDFLFKLRDNIRMTGMGGLSDISDEVSDHIKRIDEYINLFILRQFAAVDADAVNVTPATTKRRYKKLYERLDAQKNNMAENEIYTYTSVCQQRLGVDTSALPQYSALLSRLNNTFLGGEIGDEHYNQWFDSTTDAVRYFKQRGYLTVSEDNKRYTLTDLGKEEVGWL